MPNPVAGNRTWQFDNGAKVIQGGADSIRMYYSKEFKDSTLIVNVARRSGKPEIKLNDDQPTVYWLPMTEMEMS